jgi:hypothetical protein
MNLNDSDRSPERQYVDLSVVDDIQFEHRYKYPLHVGAYFDPGMEFGQHLDNPVAYYDAESFREEVASAFAVHDDRNYLIKSHFISENLDWVVEAFPGCKIIMLMTGVNNSMLRWTSVGGFDITYPNYSAYLNEDAMMERMMVQHKAMRDFAYEHTTPIHMTKRFALDQLKIDPSDPNTHFQFIHSIGQSGGKKSFKFKFPIAFYNFEDMF